MKSFIAVLLMSFTLFAGTPLFSPDYTWRFDAYDLSYVSGKPDTTVNFSGEVYIGLGVDSVTGRSRRFYDADDSSMVICPLEISYTNLEYHYPYMTFLQRTDQSTSRTIAAYGFAVWSLVLDTLVNWSGRTTDCMARTLMSFTGDSLPCVGDELKSRQSVFGDCNNWEGRQTSSRMVITDIIDHNPVNTKRNLSVTNFRRPTQIAESTCTFDLLGRPIAKRPQRMQILVRGLR